MDLTILLADAAEAHQTGKVSAIGLGWSVTGTPLNSFAVIILLEIGWDEANRKHEALIRLVDGDGREVARSTPMGDQPLRIEAQFEAGRPAGLLPGTPLTQPIVCGIPAGLPLQPGRYEWRVTINGEERAAWCRSFTVNRPQ